MKRAAISITAIAIASAVFLPLIRASFLSGAAAAGWIFSVFLGIFVYIVFVIARASARRRVVRRIEQLDEMSGQEFEAAVASLLKKAGYRKIEQTQETRDAGIDVIGVLDGEVVGFQCKRYAKNVGNHAVMEAYAGIQNYELDRAVIVTNAYFTKAAEDLAEKTGVELWDRDVLMEML